MEQYITQVAQRYENLNEEQKRLIRNLSNTDTGRVIAFLLGPEMADVLREIQREAQQTQVEPEFLRG